MQFGIPAATKPISTLPSWSGITVVRVTPCPAAKATGKPCEAGLRDETIDRVLVTARSELELGARNSDYRTFQERWVQLVPAIMLYQPLYTFVTSEQVGSPGLDGRDIDSPLLLIGREDRYRNVTRWFVESSRELRGTLR